MYTKQSQKFMKATALTALMLTFGFAAATPAHAQLSESSVVNSGDNADISNFSQSLLEVSSRTTNNANVNQHANLQSNTGHNVSEGNIGGGGITTGPALVDAAFDVMANHSMTGIMVGGGETASALSSDVVNTGDHTSVDSRMETHRRVNAETHNNANVNQHLTAKSNTGYNKLDGNINTGTGGGAGITTSAAQALAEFGVDVNHADTLLDLGSGGSLQGSEQTVTNTGDGASVENSSRSRTEVDARTHNNAYVTQKVYGDSNTGHNWVKDGIGSGSILSAAAGFNAGFESNANHSMTGITGGWGMSDLFNLSDFVNTGDHTESNNDTHSRTRVNSETSNSLTEYSSMNFKSNTGYNGTDGNIGGGTTTSNAAFGLAEMSSDGNHSDTFIGDMADVLTLLFLGS